MTNQEQYNWIHQFMLLIVLCSLVGLSYGQSTKARFAHISVEDGLSQATILSIVQDNLGFIWVGTADGLNQYNGYEFKTFRNMPGNPNSLSDNEVMALYDDGSSLWIGTARGVDKLNKLTTKCSHYNSKTPTSLSDEYVTAIYPDKTDNNIVWIGTANGLNRFNLDTDEIEVLYPDTIPSNAMGANVIRTIKETSGGVLYVGTDLGVYSYDRGENRLVKTHLLELAPEFIDCRVLSIEEDGEFLWFGTNRGLLRYHPGTSEVKTFMREDDNPSSLTHSAVKVVYKAPSGNLWIGTDTGLNLYSYNDETFLQFRHIKGDTYSLSNNTIHSIFEDQSGILWIGSGSGLNKFDPRAYQFNPSKIEYTSASDLVNNKVWSILEENENLWLGTEGGLYKLILNNEGAYKGTQVIPSNQPLSHPVIKSMVLDKTGNLWLGTQAGLDLVNLQSNTVQSFKSNVSNPTTLGNNEVRTMVYDTNDNLWIGTANGLNRMSSSNVGRFDRFNISPQGTTNVKFNSIRYVLPTAKGELFLGTEGGLVRFNPHLGTYKTWSYDAQDSTTLSHNFVRTIYEDHNGQIWVGTSGGLNLLDYNENGFEHFRLKDGLPNEVVYAIQEDKENRLWISTNKGLSRFDPELKTFKNFDKNDGLQNNEFNTNSVFKNMDGRLYFGGINGFNSFLPEEIKDNIFIPPVVFTGFEIMNKDVQVGESYPLKRSINASERINLEYTDHMFTFRYAGLNYTNSKKNLYMYKLEGFDEDWNEVGYRRFATYANIPGGEYIFKVKASNNSGLWNEEGTNIKVVISTPYWDYWWFKILIVVFAIVASYIFYRYRIRTINRKKLELEGIVIERTKEILQQKTKAERAYKELNETLTKLKETQSQLIQSEKMATLGQLTAGVAHEINNPVNFIYTGINGLQKNLDAVLKIVHEYANQSKLNLDSKANVSVKDPMTEPEYVEALHDITDLMGAIKEGAERATQIVKCLRIFSRTDETVVEQCNLHDGLKSTIQILESQLHDGLEIRMQFANNLPGIECNPGQINQVFMNLLNNSIQAIGDENGIITVSTERHEECVKIIIEDTGVGISAAAKDRIFEPFFSTKEVGQGTGLGLSITFGIIQEHSGKINVNSEEGSGTMITITLPVSQKRVEELG